MLAHRFNCHTGALLLLSSSLWTTKAQSGPPPDWFLLIQRDFNNHSFPLKQCPKRNNIAPHHGSGCGPKSKTCFFGDQTCGAGGNTFAYPAESCTCDGKRGNLGTWRCQPELCAQEECRDAVIESQPWVDSFYDTCITFAQFGYCPDFGNDVGLDGNLTANEACCTCGGGTVVPFATSSQCTDNPIIYDPPLLWTDSLGDNCAWYAEDAQTRCNEFANEQSGGVSVIDGCCACKIVDIIPSTCTDLQGWTTADSRSCSEMTRFDCQQGFPEWNGAPTENFGFTPTEACCKCGGGSNNPSIPSTLKVPSVAYTAGLCSSDSSKFNMCIKVAPNVAPRDIIAIVTAESKWSSVIAADNPAFMLNNLTQRNETFLFEGVQSEDFSDLNAFYSLPQLCGYDPGFPITEVTDDVNVCIKQSANNGIPFGVVASELSIYADNFIRFSVVEINADTIRFARKRGLILEHIMIHEFGHVLGIGSWENAVQLTGKQLQDSQNCMYLGENANRVYQDISGCPATVSLPLQDTTVIPVSGNSHCGTHLNQQCFRNEVMTPTQDNTATKPLSVVTLALLEDLGYTVDYSKADPFDKSNLDPSCVCDSTRADGGRLLQEEKPRPPARRPLSKRGLDSIVAYATTKLEAVNSADMPYMRSNDGVAVGIPGMMVMYMEEGEIYSQYVASPDI